MSSNYKGLYVIRNTENEITDIQISAGAHEIPLPIKDYEERDIQPPISSLLEKDEYFNLKG
ncbi:MAG: hypothetical protein HGB15_02130 [Chlorobaculum sp.]|nr:hypothetical protein [Chlorobaculum sp.]